MPQYWIVPKSQSGFWDMIDQSEFTFEYRSLLKQVKIRHVEIDTDAAVWEIILNTQEKLPAELIKALCEQLKEKCQLSDVFIEQSVMLFSDYLDVHWDSFVRAVANGIPTVTHLLTTARRNFDGCALTLEFDSELAEDILKEHSIKQALKHAMENECFRAYDVNFIFNETKLDPTKDIMTPEYRQALAEPRRETPGVSQGGSSVSNDNSAGRTGGNSYSGPRRSKNVTDAGMILGRKIQGRVSRISSIDKESDQVIFEGHICQLETRELRTKKFLLTFDIGDSTNGMSCKVFLANQEQNDSVQSQLSNGMLVKIKGNVKFDTFANDLCFFVESIVGLRGDERMDNAELKRVELHAHTHMSDMDSVVSIKSLIQTAARWGHSAVAITDHGVVQAFLEANKHAKKEKMKMIYGMEGYLIENDDWFRNQSDEKKERLRSNHIILLAQNPIGIRNLYKIVSISHLRYLYRSRPMIPRKIISEYREGLIIGSACEAGELIQAIIDKADDEKLLEIASFYDYLEIQPIGNNQFMIRDERDKYADIKNEEDLRAIVRKVAWIAEKLDKPLVATCDVHFLNPEDEVYRRILMAGKGFKDADSQPPIFYRTTDEMLAEFQFLGAEKAYECVVLNSRRIADSIEAFEPICDEEKLYSPQIPGSDEQIRAMSYRKAEEQYGNPLPKLVADRLEMELRSIIGHGYAVLYLIAQKLVKKSLDDGYLVGSRGSVGSSFVAHMTDITEVNSLPPHWRCPHCCHSEFVQDGSYSCGFDLPDKACPNCGTPMLKNGHDIPFAVFMGFNGDKVPDIDLNFSGDYQPVAHKYTEVLFGKDNVFKAGTIGTVADKTAYGYIKNYFTVEIKDADGKVIDKRQTVRNAYINTLVAGCAGVKRTTGQHPGGIMVIPRNIDVHYFTPIQHPANDKNTPIITTHFDYHAISGRLVKLDILGHDDPTVIKMLEDLTGRDPKTIPFDDPATMSLFSSTEALGVSPEELGSQSATYAVPEFGTSFVRKMLEDTKPKTFTELLRISGFSHGTNVWLDNAQELIRSGTAKVSEAISTRDDIMNYLMMQGVEPLLSFKTMENVRKGRGLTPEVIEILKKANVPDWFIESCLKIKYLFPKAHAVAYVMMAYRIAYCKVHYPLAFYAAYFTVRAKEFDADLIAQGKEKIKQKLHEFERMGNDLPNKEKDLQAVLELALEMHLRGFKMEKIDLYASDSSRFIIHDGSLLPPLGRLQGVGDVAAKNIVAAREVREFSSIEDLKLRASISKTTIEALRAHGCLAGMTETDQMELFG